MKNFECKNDQYGHNVLINLDWEIMSPPTDVTEVIGATMTTMSFNVKLPDSVTIVKDDEQFLLEKGTVLTATARGKQYNPEIHKLGGKTFISFSWGIGQENPIVSAATINSENGGYAPVFKFSNVAVKQTNLVNSLTPIEQQ